jgi:DNA-binding transcriptional MerR regulator
MSARSASKPESKLMPPNLQVFELAEMAEILGLPLAKAKNWTNERTGLVIEPSIRKATGTGSRNLYSVEDLYLMAIAREFSRAGFAPAAIAKVLEAIKPRLPKLRWAQTVTVSRPKPSGPFRLLERKEKPDAGLWHTLQIGPLLDAIDSAAERFQNKLTH